MDSGVLYKSNKILRCISKEANPTHSGIHVEVMTQQDLSERRKMYAKHLSEKRKEHGGK